MAEKKNFEIVEPEVKPLPQDDIEDIFEEDDAIAEEETLGVDEEEGLDEAAPEEDDEGEEDSDSEDDEAEEPEPEQKPSAKKSITKEQRKIIESKKTIRSLNQRIAELEATTEKANAEAKLREKAAAYIEEGFPEEKAKELARKDLQTDNILERLETAEFRSINAFTLAKYPTADVKKVMATMRASGADIDVVCRLLYGSVRENDSERRIREATERRAKAVAASPTGAKKATPGKTLTREQQADKKVVERFLRKPLTVDEYLKNHT